MSCKYEFVNQVPVPEPSTIHQFLFSCTIPYHLRDRPFLRVAGLFTMFGDPDLPVHKSDLKILFYPISGERLIKGATPILIHVPPFGFAAWCRP
jgi:hypothetical protein